MLRYIWFKLIKKLQCAGIRNSKIDKTSKVEAGSQVVNCTMDRHSFCGYYCEITNCDIGSFCSIANGVKIGGGMHPINWVGTSPVFYEGRDSVKAKYSEFQRSQPRRTTIGHDVWIGQDVLIKQGLTIGIGSIIGMGSVVTKDVPPYTIVGGNPARVIRDRFQQEISNKLLKSKWWELEDKPLQDVAKFIKEPIKFLEYLGEKTTNNI